MNAEEHPKEHSKESLPLEVWENEGGEILSVETGNSEINKLLDSQLKRTKRSPEAKSFVAPWRPNET